MNGKSPFASRTLWVNIITIAIDAIGHFTDTIPASAQPYIAMGLAVANIVLRFLTNQPLSTGK